MSQISIIIVSWNACGYLRNCLNSIRETGNGLVRETIVVDNASSDGSPEMVAKEFPEVVLIRSAENLGFARANNLGIKRATAPFFALINSDVIVHSGCFETLVAQLADHPEVGLAGPKVFGRDKLLQITCGRLPTVWNSFCEFALLGKTFPRWSFLGGFQMSPADHERQREVEVLSGCFMMARNPAVQAVGGLDDRFFFYAEDVDWCKRFGDAGWKVMFVPSATATHFGGGSSSQAPLRYSIEMLRANLTYWKKHHGNLGRSAFFILALVQHGLRFVARACLRLVGLARDKSSQHKFQEHRICLRWLLTGKGV
jgi:GT2 family glycosyltransferase